MRCLLNTRYDIICAQELRLTTGEDIARVTEMWTKGTSVISIGTDMADGVGIFFKDKAEIIRSREIIPGRILMVDCFYANMKLRIINVYTPPDAATKVRIFKKLYELLVMGYHTVLCGDFNAYTDANDRIPTHPFKLSREGKALKAMSDFCNVNDVFRMLCPTKTDFTRFDSKVRTRIDRIYVSEGIVPMDYQTKVLVNSDHLCVESLLRFGKSEKRGYWKLNVNCLKNTRVILELKEEIRVIKTLNVLTESEVDLWENMKERLRDFFKYQSKILSQERNKRYKCLMSKYVDLQTKTNKTEDDDNVLQEIGTELTKMNNDVFQHLRLQSGTDGNLEASGNAQSLIRQYKEKIKNKTVKGIRNEEGKVIEEEQGKREIIRLLCEKMYQQMDTNESKLGAFLDPIESYEVGSNTLGGEITKDEVIQAILKLNKGKAPGPDGLPGEFYQECIGQITDLLTSVFNSGIRTGKLHNSFYHGVISLLYKKGDASNLDNWRHVTLMNADYKILAKIIMNRLEGVLEKIVEKEQTCAIKGRVMWDNLGMLREIITNPGKEEFFIISLDQKKAFDYISREYLWSALLAHGFEKDFIDIVKLLYAHSVVQINVNGVLTEKIQIRRGVKQGCPISAALYVLAINPLLKRIKCDGKLSGTRTSSGERVVISAYADDITVIIKNQKELDRVNEHFRFYEEVSGAKLNNDKTEGVWFGKSERRPAINIQEKDEMKVLGLYITNQNCYEKNWGKKEGEVKEELLKWENKTNNYKTRIELVKIFMLSKLLFLAAIFPPKDQTIKKINKMAVNFIWGTTREVTKREWLYKSKVDGGLGAMDIGIKVKIAFCKNIAAGIKRKAVWIGEALSWTKKKGRARSSIPYYKLVYSDFINKYENLSIDWAELSNKNVYATISDEIYGGVFPYKNLDASEAQVCINNVFSKNISENKRDTMWLVSVNRLAVRAIVKWSCYVKTIKCPMENCNDDETIEHLVLRCQRSREVWGRMPSIGFNINVNLKAVMYGVFQENMSSMHRDFYWTLVCTVVVKIWKTRCKVILGQVNISSETVFRQIITELKRQRTLDTRQKKHVPWHLIKL